MGTSSRRAGWDWPGSGSGFRGALASCLCPTALPLSLAEGCVYAWLEFCLNNFVLKDSFHSQEGAQIQNN